MMCPDALGSMLGVLVLGRPDTGEFYGAKLQTIAEALLCHIVGKLASGQRFLLHTCVNTCTVERKGVCRRKHTDVGKDGRVVFRMTIAVGRNVNDQ